MKKLTNLPFGSREEYFLSDIYSQGKALAKGIKSKLILNDIKYSRALLLLYVPNEDIRKIRIHSEFEIKGYSENMAIAVVRDRWQVTIPPQVRGACMEPGSALVWEAEEDRLVVTPYTGKKKPDWNKIWAGIKKCRSYKSTAKQMPLSEFIIQDREKHRI